MKRIFGPENLPLAQEPPLALSEPLSSKRNFEVFLDISMFRLPA